MISTFDYFKNNKFYYNIYKNKIYKTVVMGAVFFLMNTCMYSYSFSQENNKNDNVLNILETKGNHSKFLEIINIAGLNKLFDKDSPIKRTVFTPTDESFNKVPIRKLF